MPLHQWRAAFQQSPHQRLWPSSIGRQVLAGFRRLLDRIVVRFLLPRLVTVDASLVRLEPRQLLSSTRLVPDARVADPPGSLRGHL